METKKCKIHGIMPKTLEYFYISKEKYWYCRECQRTYIREYLLKDNKNIGNHYVKKKLIQRIKFNTGKTLSAKELSKDLIELEKLAIIKSRQPKYSFENKDFTSIASLCRYIEDKYNIKYKTVQKRINNNYSLNELVVGKYKEKYIVNNLEFSTLKEISNYFLLKHYDLINNLYKDKTLEETVNYLLWKKQQ